MNNSSPRSRELIQQANDDLIAAEKEGFSDERIDRVFRVFHTLKGSAAVVDLPCDGSRSCMRPRICWRPCRPVVSDHRKL